MSADPITTSGGMVSVFQDVAEKRVNVTVPAREPLPQQTTVPAPDAPKLMAPAPKSYPAVQVEGGLFQKTGAGPEIKSGMQRSNVGMRPYSAANDYVDGTRIKSTSQRAYADDYMAMGSNDGAKLMQKLDRDLSGFAFEGRPSAQNEYNQAHPLSFVVQAVEDQNVTAENIWKGIFSTSLDATNASIARHATIANQYKEAPTLQNAVINEPLGDLAAPADLDDVIDTFREMRQYEAGANTGEESDARKFVKMAGVSPNLLPTITYGKRLKRFDPRGPSIYHEVEPKAGSDFKTMGWFSSNTGAIQSNGEKAPVLTPRGADPRMVDLDRNRVVRDSKTTITQQDQGLYSGMVDVDSYRTFAGDVEPSGNGAGFQWY